MPLGSVVLRGSNYGLGEAKMTYIIRSLFYSFNSSKCSVHV